MNLKNTSLFNFLKIGCLLKLHQFETIREISSEIKEVRCKVCGKEFGIYKNISTFYPLSQELKNAHNGDSNYK